MIRNIFLLLFLIPLFWACENSGSNRFHVNTSHVDIEEVQIHRYGRTLFSLDTADLQNDLKRIQPDFLIFLDGDLDDPETLDRMMDYLTDPILVEANAISQETFVDLKALESEFKGMFRHLKYHFPESQTPTVYAYISGYDYEFATQYYNNNLLIALDMYLGPEYSVYQNLGVPQYVIRRFEPSHIAPDCAHEMGMSVINHRKVGNHLIDLMINEGKLLWFVKSLLPQMDESLLFDYTDEQMAWALKGEGLVWAFMIENEVLYSSDPDYVQKLIMEGPFTSYFGNESPPRLGTYIGFRMVDAYMQRNENVSLADLMQEYDPRKILKLSNYKPDY